MYYCFPLIIICLLLLQVQQHEIMQEILCSFLFFTEMGPKRKVVSDYERLRRFGTVRDAQELLSKFRDERVDKLWSGLIELNSELEKSRERHGECIVELDRGEIDGPLDALSGQLATLDSAAEVPDNVFEKLVEVFSNVYFARLSDSSGNHELKSDNKPCCQEDFRVLFNRLHSTFTSIFNLGLKTRSGALVVKNEDFKQMKEEHKKLTSDLESYPWQDEVEQGTKLFLMQFIVFCIVYGW